MVVLLAKADVGPVADHFVDDLKSPGVLIEWA